MRHTAIRVEALSKQYRIGRKQDRYKTLRDTLTDALASPLRRASKLLHGQPMKTGDPNGIIWALRDVAFEVECGEVVGIIGRNGAGKSTLLKILSRITEPTSGTAEFHGRLGSLLEVGTGFHAELTGRENTYLNGAILGMKKAEIDRKFDAIVDFAGIEKFIDTPVKHYSSGMYVRLAFAVAAHLEPDILIVDEVLAVGDARFQKKCLNKMQDVGRQGRTVLFVSHNMPAITRLCRRAILLEDGQVLQDGPVYQVVGAYLNGGDTKTTAVREWLDPAQAPGGEVARLRVVRARTEDGRIAEEISIRQPFKLEIEYEVLKPGYVLLPNFSFFNEDGIHVFSTHDIDPAWSRCPRPTGRYLGTVHIPGNLLTEGMMYVGVGLETLNPSIYQFYEADAIVFCVVDDSFGSGDESARGDYAGHISGVLRPLLKWSNQYMPNECFSLSAG